MRVLIAFLALSNLLLITCSPQCAFILNDAQFDLTGLKTTTDYTAKSSGFDAYTYYLNVCGNANHPTPCAGAICQYDSFNNYVATVARWDTAPPSAWSLINPNDPNEGVKLSFSNGDKCFGLGLARVAHLSITCTPNDYGGVLRVVDDHNGCMEPGYQFAMSSCHACPGGCDSLDAITGATKNSTLFIIFVVGGFAVYFSVGYMINRRKNREKEIEPESWVDNLPNINFWRQLPGLVKDGCIYSLGLSKSALSKFSEWKNSGGSDGGDDEGSSDPATSSLLNDEDLDDDLGYE